MRPEQLEELSVYSHKPPVVLEQSVDHDRADYPVLQLKRDAGGRRTDDVALCHVQDTGEVRALDDGFESIVGGLVAQLDLLKRPEVDSVGRDGHEVALGVVDEVDSERAHPHELHQELLDVADDGAHPQGRMELEARDIKIGEAL